MDIAVLCDDAHEAAVLALALQRADLASVTVVSFDDLIERWADYAADGIILASSLACSEYMLDRLREVALVPVIVVCDALSEAQHIALLEHGATQVLARPYSLRVLALSMRALLQLTSSMRLVPASMEVAGIVLNPQQRTVMLPSQAARRLTYLEFRLLYVLVQHYGQVVATDKLIERVWGYSSQADSELLRKLVHRLRDKIEPQYIQTVAGIGYRFVAPDNTCC
jgi:DNA-binding response OmpR family regulator